MQNTQLQEILQKFTKKEIKSFTEYLNSPYFNKKITLILFWEAIKVYAPEFQINETQKEKICYLVSGKSFNAPYYRNLCSDMMEVTLNFLAEEQFHRSPVEILQLKNEILIENGLFGMSEKNIINLSHVIDNSLLSYPAKLNHRIRLDDNTFRLGIRRNRSKHERISKLMLNEAARKRIVDFALGKLFLHILNDYRASKYLKKPFNYREADHYFAIYENGLTSKDDFVTAYYLTTKLIISMEEKYYFDLKEMLVINKVNLPVNELSNLLIGLLDYLALKVETGEMGWRNEMFEIYEFRIKNNLWKLHTDFAYTSLINIVENSLALGKISYTEEMVEKYSPQITKNLRNHLQNLCYAWISFYKGDLTTAHNYLLPIETENVVIKYSIRSLQVMIYFQNGEYQTLSSYIDSFKHFINYNTESIEVEIRKSGITFCNFTSLLIKLKLDPDQKKAAKVRKEVNESKFLMKDWVLRQL